MINTIRIILMVALAHPILTTLAIILIADLFKKIKSKIVDAADEADYLKNQNIIPDNSEVPRMRTIIEPEYRCPGSEPVEHIVTEDGYEIYLDKDGNYRYESSGELIDPMNEIEFLRSGYFYYTNTPGYAEKMQAEEEERQRLELERQEEEEREKDWLYFLM